MAGLENFIEVPVGKLVKASWNYKTDDPKLLKKLVANFKRNGQVENIIVRELDTGFYEVVNGNHRLDAVSELGFKTVVCYNCGPITTHEAIRLSIETNETKFATDELTLAQRITELVEQFTIEDLQETMPYDKTGFEGFMRMADFDWNGLPTEQKEPSKFQMGEPIKLTQEQRKIVDEAIGKARREVEDYSMKEGRAIELICADYLAGAPKELITEAGEQDPND